MKMVEYKQLNTEEIISFIANEHEIIDKSIDLNGKDSDLLDLGTHYGASNAGFGAL